MLKVQGWKDEEQQGAVGNNYLQPWRLFVVLYGQILGL